MKYRSILSLSLFIIVAFFALFILSEKRNGRSSDVNVPESLSQRHDNETSIAVNDIILFYGDGCPHCALVEKYVAENGVAAKIPFVKKEVYYNDKNAEELAAKAKICGLPTDSIGVPFLWDGSNCFVGDQDIIDFFKENASRK